MNTVDRDERHRVMRAHLRIRDVADALSVSRRTVTRWISTGQLKARKLGPSKQAAVRIDPAELSRFLEGAEG